MSLGGLKSELKIIELFRLVDPWIHGQTIYAFLIIAQHTYINKEDMRVMDIGDLMDTSSASASRNLRFLVDHDLINLWENPNRRIEKFVELTQRGKRLVKRLEAIR